MIERRNIIKLLSDRVNAYHSAILTCYSFDPIFFESVYLPTLRRLGITNIIVLADAGMYDQMLSDAAYHCHKVTMNGYTLVRQENLHNGVFHTKMLLLFGMDEGAIIIGSGNITFSGMSNNTEVWNAFHVKGAESPCYPMLKTGWEYAKELLVNSTPLVNRQLEWIEEQTEWINTIADENVVSMTNGETATFLYNDRNESIYSAMLNHIGNTEVEAITVIAPFYDTKGEAINRLRESLRPKKFRCFLDIERQSAPYDLLENQSDIDFFKYTGKCSPLHAKMIEIQADNGTWLLSGSANIGNMALGTSRIVYNDEACVLVHSEKKRSFIKELGLENNFKALFDDELKTIKRPKTDDSPKTNKILTILSCELSGTELQMTFNKQGIDCDVVVFNHNLNKISSITIQTCEQIKIETTEDAYLVVLFRNGEEISNRCLVLSELNVERCNPDPKRRKLSSLLDDTGLMENINHILGFIEFDDENAKQNLTRSTISGKKEKKDELGNTVSKEQFDLLKDNSILNISMHSGVRILSFLKDILFKKDDAVSNDDELLELQPENENNINTELLSTTIEKRLTDTDLSLKLRNDVYSYLDRMKQFLVAKSEDPSIQVESRAPLPIEGKGNLPKLTAKPGLNQSSAFAVATTVVSYLMQNFGNSIVKKAEVRERFYECTCLFTGMFGQNFKMEGETYRERKSYEMLKDATSMLLVSLCHFDFGKLDYQLMLTVLNGLDAWKDDKEALTEIVESFRNKIANLDNTVIINNSYVLINSITERYMSEEAPVSLLSEYEGGLFIYRAGYGFFYADGVKRVSDKWHFSYHHPRYCNDNILLSGITKYKGYKYSDFK